MTFSIAQVSSNMKIDIDINMIRERSVLNSKASSRSFSISLSTSSVPYYWHIEINNNLLDIKSQEPIDSSQLSYKANKETVNSVIIVTDKPSPKEGQYVYNEVLAVRIEDDGLSFILFYFHFPLFFFIFIVDHKTKKTKCDTITGHMTGHKNHIPT